MTTFQDDFNAGTPGAILTGPYAAIGSTIRYTNSGRDGTVGVGEGTPGGGAYFAYGQGDTDTLVSQVDFIYRSGTGAVPASGAVGGGAILYLYGVDAQGNAGTDIFQYNVGTDSGGAYHEFFDYVNGFYDVYPIEPSDTYTRDFYSPARSHPPYDTWRTARASLSAGVMTFELLDSAGAVSWSYDINMPGWLVSAVLVGVSHDSDATYDRSVDADNFIHTVPDPAIAYVDDGVRRTFW